MEQHQEIHPEYLNGFNVGYSLSEYAPEIGNQLAELMKDDERGRGFNDGRNQFELEKSFERYPSFFTENRKEITRDSIEFKRDFNDNKDDFEIERE